MHKSRTTAALPVLDRRTLLVGSGALLATAALPERAKAQEGFPVTLEHARGTLTLDKPAERIVFVSEEFIEVAVAMNIAPAAVGIWRSEIVNPFEKLPYLDQPVKGAPLAVAGSEPNIEALLGVNPDLIIFHDYLESPQDEVVALYKKVAPTATFYGSIPGEWKKVARAVGLATGKLAKADEIAAAFDADVAKLRAQMAPIVARHPTVTPVFGWGESSGYFDERFAVGANFVRLGLTVRQPLGDRIDPSGFSIASAETVPSIDADTVFVWRGDVSPFDPLLARLPMPVLEMPLPHGIGYTGPFAERIYMQAIVDLFTKQYGAT